MLSTEGKWRYPARLGRVIDGDTVVLNLDLGMNLVRSGSYRLYGINAIEHDEPSTEHLTKLLTDAQFIEVETYKKDKYGRYLVNIFTRAYNSTDWLNVNQNMIDNKFAVEYFGGKR
jgi:endonuclease YncB( thermonuclease family)